MLTILLIVSLMVVFVQDIRERKIYLFLPFLILALSLLIDYQTDKQINLATLFGSMLLIGSLWIYVFFRFKSIKLFSNYFGLGDALILIAVAPLFSLHAYLYFTALVCIVSLILFVLIRQLKNMDSIPFAGYLSLVLGGLIILDFCHISFELIPI